MVVENGGSGRAELGEVEEGLLPGVLGGLENPAASGGLPEKPTARAGTGAGSCEQDTGVEEKPVLC